MNAAVILHLATSTTAEVGTDSLQRCRRALEMLLTHRGNPALEVERVLADDPECVFGHCLRAALIVCADQAAARSSLAVSVAAIEAACPDADDRAYRHAAAARAWLDGDSVLALERYGAIVVDWPRDILALVVAHALDFRLGRRRMLRDRIAQVLPQWQAAMPGYASVLAMYAFGLEENGQYRRAEKTARRALALDPRHPGAIHVVAHLMEMQGRAREGLAFLAATESAWADRTGFSIHLAWHRALLAFARSDYAACIELLVRVRHITHRCGGSLAQCDLIHLTFTEAALRARQARLACALVAERVARKPASRLNRLLQQRLGMIAPAMA